MREGIEQLKQQFAEIFGQQAPRAPEGRPPHGVHVVRAPGRVNLIGEHTDYNDGFVLPMAIEPHVLLACRVRDDGRVRLASGAYPHQIVQFSVQEKIERGKPAWANYSRGVAAELIAAGIPLSGMDALLHNTLPIGGGLSSSAAIEVATAQAFLLLAGLKMDPSRIALLCQRAEHEYARVPCGIMDQTIVASAQAGQAMLLDCRDLSKTFVPIDPNELRVMIVNSMVKHDLASGEYAVRRKQCEQGTALFRQRNDQVRALRDVDLAQLESAGKELDNVIFHRCRHVVSENQRTTAAAALLAQQKYEQAGELMLQSHASLRDDFEVSSPELDFLVEQAMTVKGVYGARMTGGGFGGCIVALVQPRSVESFTDHIRRSYTQRFDKDPAIFATNATEGVSVLE